MQGEVVAVLDPQPGQVLLDCTLGGGGHASALAERLLPGGRLIGLDQDPDALAEAGRRLLPFGEAVVLRQARFDASGASFWTRLALPPIDGVLFDLGVSSLPTGHAGAGVFVQRPGRRF